MNIELITADNIEIPYIDDVQIPFERQVDVSKYNPYKILPPFGCGKKLDQFG